MKYLPMPIKKCGLCFSETKSIVLFLFPLKALTTQKGLKNKARQDNNNRVAIQFLCDILCR